jgi:hypothetical protein
MIRSVTLLCALLAAGSGLFLYQTKHQAQLLDLRIRRVREATAALREHASVLRADYALLNDPQRLADLAAAHLPDLKPTQPAQWSTLAELDRRLPPVGGAGAVALPPEPESAPLARGGPDAAPMHPIIAARPAPAAATLAGATPAARPLARLAPRQFATAVARPTVLAVQSAPLPAPPPGSFHAARFAGAAAIPAALPVRQAPPPDPVLFAASSLPPPHPDADASGRATTPEATARIGRGGPIAPAVPMVASSLAMARTLVTVAPAAAATLYTVGTAR